MELKDRIKIIFFDVDFTAFDHVHFMVRPLTMYALRQLKKKGYRLCICTSRSYDEMKMIDQEFLKIMDAVITLAGGLTFKNNGNIIKNIRKAELIKAVSCLEENSIIYRYATADGMGYLNRSNDYIDDFFFQYYHMVPPVKPYENEDVVQIMYYPIKQDDIHEKLMNLNADFVVKPMRLSNEIADASVDKGKTVIDVVKSFGLKPEEAMSFGDSENDIVMFENTGFSICMASGEEEAKKHADYVCEKQDEDGIYKTFVKYGFIEPYEERNELFDYMKGIVHLYSEREKDIAEIASVFVETIRNNGIIQLLGIGKYGQFAQEFYYRSGGLAYFHKMEYNGESLDELLGRYVIDPNDMYVLISEALDEDIIRQLADYVWKNSQKLMVFCRKDSDLFNKADYAYRFIECKDEMKHTADDSFAQMIFYATYRKLKEEGIEPLVFMSNNNPDSKEHNKAILERYPGRIHE